MVHEGYEERGYEQVKQQGHKDLYLPQMPTRIKREEKMAEKITQEQRLQAVVNLAKNLNKPISVRKFIRHKVIREEIVLAYQSPVPSAVQVYYQTLKDDKYVTVKANRQVNKGNWIVIRQDGSQETYTLEEFEKIYEPMKESRP